MLRQTALPLPVLADGMRLPPRSDRGGEGHESAVPGFCRRIRRNAARNTAGRKRQGAAESRSSRERLSCEGERAVGASAPRPARISAMFARPVPLSCEHAASVPGRAARGRTPRGGAALRHRPGRGGDRPVRFGHTERCREHPVQNGSHAPPKLAEAHRAVGSGAPAGAASAIRRPICTVRPGRGTFRADENLSVFHYFISLIYSSICNTEPIHPREPSCLSGTIRLLLPTGTANLRSTTVVSLKKEKTCRKKQPCWP